MTELDDDREEFSRQVSADEAGDPAAAFDALRQTVEGLAGDLTREMTTIRKGVEAAFEEFDRQGPVQDYKPELAQLVQQLAHVGERLQDVEQSPILKNGPQHYAAALERSGESLVRTAAQQFENESRDFQRVARDLAGHVAGARQRHVQNRFLWIVGAAGVLAGIILTLFLPALLPFSADSHIASLVMGFDRVSAGYAMIGAVDPLEVEKMKWGGRFYNASGREISACLETAKQTGKDQKCTITVPAPLPR
ncbi:hypothetical protein KHQ08_18390 (plasmid) [Pseudochrobactrum algeriensis]|uniref:DUF6118 family protein n=1 Tax=Pseudochrobactrum algeriensis TaxID=2834768 RepID=UPI001BD155C6|nr:DUF6118 family protein [Pseudochrobactrum algeriensis]QVQ38713.1 hypothetical protein KHQ08_18390 [Pseudochrobactrum algeriensis]QVQ38768.1 hypothetical protein KHQ07_00215 [Pseudochrobactrum algeriensis]QVQ42251.1 hypothetical protein KHQ09_00010 [Pseudochrobactrum algeriensis]